LPERNRRKKKGFGIKEFGIPGSAGAGWHFEERDLESGIRNQVSGNRTGMPTSKKGLSRSWETPGSSNPFF